MISGGYKSAAFKLPARIAGRAPVRYGGFANPSRMGSLPNAGELKFKDTTVSVTPSSNAFTLNGATLVNGLVPDSTASGRIGRRVVIKSLLIRGFVKMAPTSVGGTPTRMLVIYDKQANATLPAMTDVLTTNEFFGVNNISNRDRFTILMDQYVDPVGTGTAFCQPFKFYKTCALPVQYNAGVAGTIGDITSGSLFVVFAPTDGVTVAQAPVVCQVRIRYADN